MRRDRPAPRASIPPCSFSGGLAIACLEPRFHFLLTDQVAAIGGVDPGLNEGTEFEFFIDIALYRLGDEPSARPINRHRKLVESSEHFRIEACRYDCRTAHVVECIQATTVVKGAPAPSRALPICASSGLRARPARGRGGGRWRCGFGG